MAIEYRVIPHKIPAEACLCSHQNLPPAQQNRICVIITFEINI